MLVSLEPMHHYKQMNALVIILGLFRLLSKLQSDFLEGLHVTLFEQHRLKVAYFGQVLLVVSFSFVYLVH